MSRFRADSDVGRLNASAGEWVVVFPETADVLDASLRWSIASRGRFDPCLGRTAALWDGVPTGASFPSVPGSGVEPEPLRPVWAGDLRAPVEVRRGGGAAEARVTVEDAAVDLGGIAKGFAVDQAAEALRPAGVPSGLINVGGDLVALGRAPDGGAWLVGVQDPDDPGALAATVDVADEAIATSGDYVRWFERDGRRYHHLIDPNTGEPRLTRTRSLTVRSDRCMHADAAATALFGARADVMDMIAARAPGGVRVLHEIQEETT